MNTRQGILVTGFATTLFMNFASIYWTMWSVLSMSMFVLVVTDFMFFEVWRALLHTTTTEHLGLRGVQRAVAWALACSAARLTLHPALSSLTTPLACTAPCTPRRTTSSGRE